MTQELATRQQHTTAIFNPTVWKQVQEVADVFVKSGALPKHIANSAQAILVISHGLDMDMSPTEALSSLYIVNGAVTIFGKAIIARLTGAGYKIKYEDGDCENDNAWCIATVTSPTGEVYKEKYTLEMAIMSFPVKTSYGWKPGWMPGQNRKLKLRYGAINIILKTYLPHLLYGANGLAEIDGEVLEGQVAETPATNDHTPAPVKEKLIPDTKLWGKGVKALRDGTCNLEYVREKYDITDENLERLQAEAVSVEQEVVEAEEVTNA